MQIINLEIPLSAPFRGAFAKAFSGQMPQPVFDALMKVLQVERTDGFYQGLHQGPPETFCQRLLEALGVEVRVTEEDLKRIPKSGALVPEAGSFTVPEAGSATA